jgi:DNA repair exonuclease SbcCD ATPase subunit
MDMEKITKLKLVNFKSHKNTEVDLDPGVNIFVGSNGAGRTSIRKGIIWNIENRPLGSSFIRDNQEFAESHIFTDEFCISRIRKKGFNGYVIEKGGESSELSALRADVPEEVSSAFNFGELNYTTQHDSPFMIFDSPGKISSRINEITHLDEIDKVISAINLDSRQASSRVQQAKEKQSIIERELSPYKAFSVDAKISSIESAETLLDLYEKVSTRVDVLGAHIFHLEELELILSKIPTNMFKYLDQLDKDEVKLEKLTEKLNTLCRLVESIEIADERLALLSDVRFDLLDQMEIEYGYFETVRVRYSSICELTDRLSKSQFICSLLSTIDFEAVDDIYDDVNSVKLLAEKMSKIDTCILSIEHFNSEMESIKNLIEKYVSEEKEILSNITNCPECDSVLTEQTKSILLERLA